VGDFEHLDIPTNGIRLYAIKAGEGPAVVLCHGFPGLSYSWRHQLRPLAEAGFQAVALDMRGYGRSSRPTDAREYGNLTIVDDLTGVLDSLGVERAVFVGHDFGAQSCWATALHAKDRVSGVVSIAVPYGLGFSSSDESRKSKPKKPTDVYAAIAKEHFLHLHYFQEAGPAERELGSNPEAFFRRIYWALSARGSLLDFKNFPSEGTGYLDVLAEPSEPLPWSWLTQADVDFMVAEYMQAGPELAFIGGLNSYRAMDVNWETDTLYGREPIEVPALFLCGEKDPVLDMITAKSLETMPERVPVLRGAYLIPNAGHFAQQEQPEAVNEYLVDFLREL
jgi:pimeloyl-ACP methyl ester carboxylesterase